MSESRGANIQEWIFNNRFSVALFFVMIIIFLGMSVFIGYFYDLLTSWEVRIVVSGVGAFGTLCLAIFTVLSVLETRKQTQERLKEQDKYIQERILREVNTLLESVAENEAKLYDPNFDWTTAMDVGEEAKAVYLDLHPLEIDHQTVEDHFIEEYPSAQKSINEYNNYLSEIDSTTAHIVDKSYEDISECIESFQITDSTDNLVSTERALNLVLSGKKIPRRSRKENEPDWWEWENELKQQVQTCLDGELEEFFDEKQDLVVNSSNVEGELNKVRRYIADKYPIHLQSNIYVLF